MSTAGLTFKLLRIINTINWLCTLFTIIFARFRVTPAYQAGITKK